MKALLVYDSFFGNTEKIVYSIRDALGSNIDALRVGDVEPEQISGMEYLIVCSPTRAFKPTKAITTFLKKMPGGSLKGVKVAAFDTKMDKEEVDSSVLKAFVRFFRYAAKPIADRLQKKGGTLVVPPEGFYGEDTGVPLKDGELERVAMWAGHLIETQ